MKRSFLYMVVFLESKGSFSSTTLLIYALIISTLAFVLRDPVKMLVLIIINFVSGTILGFTSYRLIIILFLLGFIGLFLNSLLISNTGETLLTIGPLTIRENALKASMNIFMRLGIIAGGTMIFISLTDPRRVIRDLERDLRLPSGIVFSIFYALRLYPLMIRDYEEIQIARLQRFKRRTILVPQDILNILQPLLSIGLERAVWAGISAELRGLSLRKPGREKRSLSKKDFLIISLALIQILLSIFL